MFSMCCCIIILTSNLGAEYLTALADGEEVGSVREQVMAVVRASFRPEFLNRLDEIVLFDRLRREDMSQIVHIQIARLQKLLEDRKIGITLDDEAVSWLAARGYDPAYGARPLKRVIQRELQDPLAEKLIAGDIRDGAEVTVTAGSDRLIIVGRDGAVISAKASQNQAEPIALLH
jgi:ATP-dependent Clp protease ATP-binding subunit ClpB